MIRNVCSDERLRGGEIDPRGSQEEERGSYAGGQRQHVEIGISGVRVISVFVEEGWGNDGNSAYNIKCLG